MSLDDRYAAKTRTPPAMTARRRSIVHVGSSGKPGVLIESGPAKENAPISSSQQPNASDERVVRPWPNQFSSLMAATIASALGSVLRTSNTRRYVEFGCATQKEPQPSSAK